MSLGSDEGDVMPPPFSADDAAASASSSSSPDAADAGGEWLFKQGDTVLGPVKSQVLIDKLKKGELPIDTLVARDGQPFKGMKLVSFFRDAHEEFVERQRAEAEERAYAAAVRKAKFLRALLVAVIVLVPSAAGAVAGRIVMVLQPWDKTADWIAKAPPIVDLAPRPPPPPRVAMVPTQATERPPEAPADEASATPADGDDAGDRVARAERGERGRPDRRRVEKRDDNPAPPVASAAASPPAGPDRGFVKELTNEQAIAPLKDVKASLGACFKAELEANPDMPSQLVLAYTITEEGRATNVEITNRELRGGSIQDCVKKALTTARWPRFEGERKNVSVPFNIKKPPKPPSSPVSGVPK